MKFIIFVVILLYLFFTNKVCLYWCGKLLLGNLDNPPTFSPDFFRGDKIFRNNWQNILAEYEKFVDKYEKGSKRVVPSFSKVYKSQHNLVENDGKQWNSIVLKTFGKEIPENTQHFPITSALVRQFPEIKSAMFSIIDPGKVIPPHSGVYKGIYKYHLGLDIPKGCSITIDDRRYRWKNGKALCFDGTFKHSVVNKSKKKRVILLLEIFRHDIEGWKGFLNKLLYGVMCNFSEAKNSAKKGIIKIPRNI